MLLSRKHLKDLLNSDGAVLQVSADRDVVA